MAGRKLGVAQEGQDIDVVFILLEDLDIFLFRVIVMLRSDVKSASRMMAAAAADKSLAECTLAEGSLAANGRRGQRRGGEARRRGQFLSRQRAPSGLLGLGGIGGRGQQSSSSGMTGNGHLGFGSIGDRGNRADGGMGFQVGQLLAHGPPGPSSPGRVRR